MLDLYSLEQTNTCCGLTNPAFVSTLGEGELGKHNPHLGATKIGPQVRLLTPGEHFFFPDEYSNLVSLDVRDAFAPTGSQLTV